MLYEKFWLPVLNLERKTIDGNETLSLNSSLAVSRVSFGQNLFSGRLKVHVLIIPSHPVSFYFLKAPLGQKISDIWLDYMRNEIIADMSPDPANTPLNERSMLSLNNEMRYPSILRWTGSDVYPEKLSLKLFNRSSGSCNIKIYAASIKEQVWTTVLACRAILWKHCLSNVMKCFLKHCNNSL